MRYDDPQLLEALAREYVLGLLPARSRARFARVLSFSLVARRAVTAWERRFAPLAAAVRPVEPPESAWTGIETALGLRAAPRARAAGIWPALAAALAIVAVLFAGLYFSQQPSVERPAYVSVVTDAATGPVWLLQAFTEARALRVSTVNPRPAPAGSSYELWMLPDGGNPVSLGLLPEMGAAQLGLNAAQLGVLTRTMTLAVSVEPAGGSPTGLPTGPVILTAPLIRS
jgi:anti-sigma-K factor RskA